LTETDLVDARADTARAPDTTNAVIAVMTMDARFMDLLLRSRYGVWLGCGMAWG
jgi:hypothetical protein